MKRRTFLLAGAAGLAGLTQTACGMGMPMGGGPMMGGMMGGMMGPQFRRNTLKPIVGRSLPIPPLYEGERDEKGTRHYYLTLAPAEHEALQDALTDTWAVQAPGVDMSILGPTLRLRRGEHVALHWRNQISEATTMHGHGMHVPGSEDGGPHQSIHRGKTWTAEFQVDQPACTNWYHPHRMGFTADHVYRGLAGLILVEDDHPVNEHLPRDYGIDDLPLAIQDRVFDGNGQLYYRPTMHETRRGYIGDILLTNGVAAPRFSARSGLLRLRLLNGSNSEVWDLSWNDGSPMAVIAGDNGLIDRPRWIRGLRLSPGERAEVVVDLSKRAGERLVLNAAGVVSGLKHAALQLSVDARPAPKRTLPAALRTLPIPPTVKDLPRRRFQMGNMMFLTINGASMDMAVINERVSRGQWEVWHVRNGMGMMHHNFHVHGGSFRVLKRRSGRLFAHEMGEKDTAYLPPGEEVWLLVRFAHRADERNPFMYHCHFLEHEDGGMMGQFTVT